MNFELLSGYVSKVVLSDDERTVASVKVVSYPDGDLRDLQASLFIHTHNESRQYGEWVGDFNTARDSITQLLDEKVPSNGLVRDSAIAPNSHVKDIQFRINKTWCASLDDDLKMKAMIRDLVDDDKATIIVSGDNPMTKRVIYFAASLGYRGHFCQVSMPWQEAEDVYLQEALALKRKEHLWQDVKGQLEKVMVEDSEFKLQIRNWKGESFTNVVDYVINAMEITIKTPLINALLKNGYIGVDSAGNLFSKHPTLFAHYTIFDGLSTGDIDSPSISIEPGKQGTQIQPWGLA